MSLLCEECRRCLRNVRRELALRRRPDEIRRELEIWHAGGVPAEVHGVLRELSRKNQLRGSGRSASRASRVPKRRPRHTTAREGHRNVVQLRAAGERGGDLRAGVALWTPGRRIGPELNVKRRGPGDSVEERTTEGAGAHTSGYAQLLADTKGNIRHAPARLGRS